MLTQEEAKNLIAFLDRVEIKGHQERRAMNEIIDKVIIIATQTTEGVEE